MDEPWPYNLPIFRRSHREVSPDGSVVAEIAQAFEVSMSNPTARRRVRRHDTGRCDAGQPPRGRVRVSASLGPGATVCEMLSDSGASHQPECGRAAKALKN